MSIFRPTFEGQCAEIVVPQNIFPRESVRCYRSAVIDGFCRQHHAMHNRPRKKTDKERIAELEFKERDFDWMNELRHKAEAENQRLQADNARLREALAGIALKLAKMLR